MRNRYKGVWLTLVVVMWVVNWWEVDVCAQGMGETSRTQEEQRQQRPSRLQPKETTGMVPLTELGTGQYKGQSGGLYGNGRNSPPPALQKAADAAASRITPLGTNGEPSKGGKIGLISLGMSNTTQQFSVFKKIADDDVDKSSDVLIVDCAQGGMSADIWAKPEIAVERQRPSPWDVMDERLKKAGLAAAQVQVVWIKQALPAPQRLGPFPRHAEVLQEHMVGVLNKLKERFPSLQLAYLSSRIYAGYATTNLNPEPYAYESAFAVRWLIDEQMGGSPELNFDRERGEVKSPVLLWGPYLWADGLDARKSDGLIWEREDLSERDGTHPSPSGRRKVAQMLLKFFKADPYAREWFVENGSK